MLASPDMMMGRRLLNWREGRITIFLLVWALVASALCLHFSARLSSAVPRAGGCECPHKWAGGYPAMKKPGSCWCGNDGFCMCTPSLAIDAIIEVTGPTDTRGKKSMPSIVLVHRRDPPVKYAIPGGFVNVGETVEAATAREVKEETNLDTSCEQFRVYSDPERDQRRHTVSSVFRCVTSNISQLKAKDDARSAKAWRLDQLLDLDLAFDHRQILIDYVRRYHHDLGVAGF